MAGGPVALLDDIAGSVAVAAAFDRRRRCGGGAGERQGRGCRSTTPLSPRAMSTGSRRP